MKKTSIAGVVLGLIATALTYGLFLGLEYFIFDMMLPELVAGGSSISQTDYYMLVEVFGMLKSVFVGLSIVNLVAALLAGRKLGNVLLTILGILELLMLITLLSAIFNLIAAGVGKKHAKKVNG